MRHIKVNTSIGREVMVHKATFELFNLEPLPADLCALGAASGDVSSDTCKGAPLHLSRLWMLLCCLELKGLDLSYILLSKDR